MSAHPVNPAALAAQRPASATSARGRQWTYVVLMLTVAAALVVGALQFAPSAKPSSEDDATLLTLIRGMAFIKAALAAVAGSAVAWRLGRPAGTPLVAAYLGGVWLMVLGSVAVWQCVHVGAAALLFHAGELTVLACAWRDGRSGWSLRRA